MAKNTDVVNLFGGKENFNNIKDLRHIINARTAVSEMTRDEGNEVVQLTVTRTGEGRLSYKLDYRVPDAKPSRQDRTKCFSQSTMDALIDHYLE